MIIQKINFFLISIKKENLEVIQNHFLFYPAPQMKKIISVKIRFNKKFYENNFFKSNFLVIK